MTSNADPLIKILVGIVVLAIPAIVVSIVWQAIQNPVETLQVLGVLALFVAFWLVGEITIQVHQRL